MKNDRFTSTTYAVSSDKGLLDEINHITPEVRRILEELQPDIEKGRKYLLKKVNRLCVKFPRVPVFKNILSTLYQQQGNIEQALAVNHWLVKEHPHYLFGKVNLAAEYLLQDKPEKIPEILGEELEISFLYPERKEFHIEEVIAVHFIAVTYFLAMDNIEEAELRVELLQDLDEDHPKTIEALDSIQRWNIIKAAMRTEARKEKQKKVPVRGTSSNIQTEEAPEFNFPEQIGWLYKDGLDISYATIENLLQLDAEKLIEDLEKMLQDSIVRFEYFLKAAEREEVEPKQLDFPQHALLLLAHLRSEESFPRILLMLQQDAKFNDFWFGYNISYLMEIALFHCGRNKIPVLFEFLKKSNIYGQNKAIVGETLVKMIQDEGDIKKYAPVYKEVLNHYITNAEDANLVDTEAISFLVSDIVDLGYVSLLPEIKQLFDLELVDTFICGEYEELEPEMRKVFPMEISGFIKDDLQDQYKFLENEEERHFFPFVVPSEYDQLYYQQQLEELEENWHEPAKSEKKIGRNEPCPCGSGKKYKKCCINKI